MIINDYQCSNSVCHEQMVTPFMFYLSSVLLVFVVKTDARFAQRKFGWVLLVVICAHLPDTGWSSRSMM
jgi:hypothetical protein